jgi:hypothetical protein
MKPVSQLEPTAYDAVNLPVCCGCFDDVAGFFDGKGLGGGADRPREDGADDNGADGDGADDNGADDDADGVRAGGPASTGGSWVKSAAGRAIRGFASRCAVCWTQTTDQISAAMASTIPTPFQPRRSHRLSPGRSRAAPDPMEVCLPVKTSVLFVSSGAGSTPTTTGIVQNRSVLVFGAQVRGI